MIINQKDWQIIRIILLIGIFVTAFILVLIEKNLLVAQATGRFKSTICQLPMEIVGLGDDLGFDNAITDLAGISPAGTRFNLFVKNNVSGTLTIWDKDKPAEKSLVQGTMDITFNTQYIDYGSEKQVTNNFFGFKAEYLQQQVIGRSFLCKFKRLSDGSYFPLITSSSTRVSFTEDNPKNFSFVARPTGVTLIIHFILLIAGLFGLIKLGESILDFIKNKN